MTPNLPYKLLTPGPLTTTQTVKEAMLRDYSTWDVEYNAIVQRVRGLLVGLASNQPEHYTAVLMQGSGTFAVEATIGSVIPRDGKLLVCDNGAYGARIAEIARRLQISATIVKYPETEPICADSVNAALAADNTITHVAVVHCETTTGILNDIAAIGDVVHRHGRTYIVDAMSSFGGMPLTMESLHVDYLISSANNCIQGVPGFGFVICRRTAIANCQTYARSLSLDLYDQWAEMEHKGGKWRYTSPTHVLNAFYQALQELAAEGGIPARCARYTENQRRLVDGMRKLGYQTLLDYQLHSPIITTFLCPDDPAFQFGKFYECLKLRGYVIYPGKITQAECFRIGNIGDVHPADIDDLVSQIDQVGCEMGLREVAVH